MIKVDEMYKVPTSNPTELMIHGPVLKRAVNMDPIAIMNRPG
jgi:hypothetical protein